MKSTIILIMVILAAGCSHHDHSHQTTLSGEEEEARHILTGYGSRHEIFAEAGLLVEGSTVTLLVHVTDLEDFSPLQEGTVTAILYPVAAGPAGGPAESPDTRSPSADHPESKLTGAKAPATETTPKSARAIPREAARQSADKPLRPGIWNLNLPAPSAGIYTLEIIVGTTTETDTVTFPNLGIHAGRQEALAVAQEQDAGHPAAVPFSKEQSWLVDFRTGVAEKKQFGPVLKTVGVVLPAHGDEITLTARASGIVNFAGRTLYEGNTSRAGEHLMEIQGGTLAEGNIMLQYSEALNNYQQAKAEYERLSVLAADRIVSERELFRAETAYRNAGAVYGMMRENFSENGQPVAAPFGGYIRHLHVRNGQHVEAGQPLVSLVRESNLVIRAEVQQRHAHLLGNIYDANIGNGSGGTYTLDELGGRVLSWARDINGNGQLLPVHLGVTDRRDLVPGAVVDVYLKTRSAGEILTVPLSALVEEMGSYFVFVQLHPESFEKRQVARGSSDGLLVEITGGLQEGERVVTRGATMVRIAAATGGLDPHAGHTH